MNHARLFAAALALATLALPAAAEEPAKAAATEPTEPKLEEKRETLKIPTAKPLGPSREEMLSQTGKVVRAYYGALKQRRYDEAAGLLHPSTTETLREAMLDRLEAASPPEKKAMLQALGAKDESSLRTMPVADFYVAWAQGPYGKGVQYLADIDLSVVLGPPNCRVEARICEVHVTLKGWDAKGETIKAPSDVWVLEDKGRWLLTVNPPKAS
jgi:hypothetical protein